MFYRSIISRLILVAFFSLGGCNKESSTSTTKPVVPAGTGIVRGVIRFIGAKPAAKTIGGDCCPGSTPVVDESLIINDNNTVKNVVVFIKDAPNVLTGPLQDKVLAQKNCQYVPHVLAMQTAQNLDVSSHDATTHNIHIEADLNPSQNFSEILAQSRSVSFAQPELVRFKCDVHPWMSAYAYVFDHPFFCVTGDDGKFEIDHLSPGNYTLAIWQEKLEPQEMQVTVKNDTPLEVQFEYRDR